MERLIGAGDQEDPRSQIIDAAAELISGRGGDSLTLGRVADFLGWPESRVHEYFAGEGDLVRALIVERWALKKVIEGLPAEPAREDLELVGRWALVYFAHTLPAAELGQELADSVPGDRPPDLRSRALVAAGESLSTDSRIRALGLEGHVAPQVKLLVAACYTRAFTSLFAPDVLDPVSDAQFVRALVATMLPADERRS